MWVICISLLVFLALLAPLRIKVSVKIRLEDEKARVSLQFCWGRLCMNSFTHRLDIESIEKILREKKWLKNREGLNVGDIRKIYQKMLRGIFIERFAWKTTLGLNNAAYTALAAGVLWIVKGVFLSFLSSQTRIKKIYVSVYPDFMFQDKNSELLCIVRTATVHIILIGIYIFYLKIRRFRYGTERNRQ